MRTAVLFLIISKYSFSVMSFLDAKSISACWPSQTILDISVSFFDKCIYFES